MMNLLACFGRRPSPNHTTQPPTEKKKRMNYDTPNNAANTHQTPLAWRNIRVTPTENPVYAPSTLQIPPNRSAVITLNSFHQLQYVLTSEQPPQWECVFIQCKDTPGNPRILARTNNDRTQITIGYLDQCPDCNQSIITYNQYQILPAPITTHYATPTKLSTQDNPQQSPTHHYSALLPHNIPPTNSHYDIPKSTVREYSTIRQGNS